MPNKSVDGIVRRRNTQGVTTVAISITVPIELNKQLEALMKKGESKSLIATILMEEALNARKGR